MDARKAKLNKTFQDITSLKSCFEEVDSLKKALSISDNDLEDLKDIEQNTEKIVKKLTTKISEIEDFLKNSSESNGVHNQLLETSSSSDNVDPGLSTSMLSSISIAESVLNSSNAESTTNIMSNVAEEVPTKSVVDPIETPPEEIKQTSSTEQIGKIKLKDISKLLDPNVLRNKVRAAKNLNASVLVISDSDDETLNTKEKTIEKCKDTTPNVRNTRRDARAKESPKADAFKQLREKRESALKNKVAESKKQNRTFKFATVISNSTSASSEDEVRSKRLKLDQNSDTSDSDDSNTVSKENGKRKSQNKASDAYRAGTSRDGQKKKPCDDLLSKTTSESEFGDSELSDTNCDNLKSKLKHRKKIKNNCKKSDVELLKNMKDKKFTWKCCVNLVRYPAEELMKLYKHKSEKLQVKRLTNLSTLKPGSKVTSESSSHSEQAKKKQKTKKSQDDSSTGNESKSSISGDDKCNSSDKEDEIANVIKKPESGKVDEALLSTINSDNEENEDMEEDSEEENKKKSSKDKKSISSSDNEKASEKEEIDKEKTSEPKGSNWRKDKLLTGKLTDSNSDEDFGRLVKRKMEEKDSDGELKAITKQKRKNRKRGKHVLRSDSDGNSADSTKSSSSSEPESDSDKEIEKKKPTRRRVKKMDDSSDEEDGKSTRKQIRKVLANDSLSETTKAAEKEEADRKARIAERQKKYNNIFEKDQLQNDSVDKVVLDFDEETNEELLTVSEDLANKLKPHQAKGIQFMFDACFESLKRAKVATGSGCILAHCMGLGKTLQVITLCHTLLTNGNETRVSRVLVVCPLSTVLNWVAEFKKWLPDEYDFEVFELVSVKQTYGREAVVKDWVRCGGVLIIGYDMFRNLTNESNKRVSKKVRNTFQTALVNPGPDLVVCDEGHLLKNEKTSISIAMNRIKSLRRVVLTGTPLQNNLKEYYCMVQFVRPNLLGTYKEYLNRFVNPITNGQYTDSTPHDTALMRKRSHVLHKMLDGIVQRKDYAVLAPFLPPKCEYVLFVSLTEVQTQLYEYYLKEKSLRNSGTGRMSFLFADFQELQRICTHPRVLLNKSIEMREKKDALTDDESEGSLKDFIDDGEEEGTSTSGSGSDSAGDKSTDRKPKGTRITRANANLLEEPEQKAEEVQSDDPLEWWRQFCTGDELDNINNSGKLKLLFEILNQCELIGDKLLIFSQSLYSLNVIEYFLEKVEEATQNDEKFCGYSGSWALGLDYFRLDGSSSCDNRAAWCNSFNNPKNTRARLFLISTRAGGLGINLVAANRVIIFDVSWNPSHDIQSIYRVYRFGQTKPTYIYRFVTMGAMEMKIYERQVTKQAISKRVIDEQQIDRHYSQHDMAELYNFQPKPKERPLPMVPRDVLLAELLTSSEERIFKYHEHQSLLENKEDEVLDEAERQAAWEEFQSERQMQNLAGTYVNAIPMSSIVAALTSIMKKDNPALSTEQIRTQIPQLVVQLQGQMAEGDNKMYDRISTEISLIQRSITQQRAQEYYKQQQQQQAMKILQFQQMMNNPNIANASPDLLMQQLNNYRQIMNNVPGTSDNRNRRPMPTAEIIELND